MTLSHSVYFTAAAGTGKTQQIVNLYKALIRQRPYPEKDGILPDVRKGGIYDGRAKIECNKMVMLTFTDNAAAEMRLRIVADLEAELFNAKPEEEQELWQLLRQIPAATIGTIHSFAKQLLECNALLLGISPAFAVIERQEADELLADALEESLQEEINAPDSSYAENLRALCASHGSGSVLAMARRAIVLFCNHGLDPARESVMDHSTAFSENSDNPAGSLKAKDYLRVILALARAASRRYALAKSERCVLDFDDLIIYALELAKRHPGLIPKYSVLIIDEAQDNSRAQNELIKLVLQASGADLVVCGDRKQSIYFWRGADLAGMDALAASCPGKIEKLALQTNYRSQAGMLTFINELFAKHVKLYLPDDTLQPTPAAEKTTGPNVELILPDWEQSVSADLPDGKMPFEVTANDLKKAAAEGEDIEWPDTGERVALEARAIARRILLLTDHGQDFSAWRPAFAWNAAGRQWEKNRPFNYRDIMILLRRTTHQEKYENALKELGIPYSTDGKGRGFFYRQETLDIAGLLNWLAFPEDNTALAALLRSPFCALSDSAIALIFYHANSAAGNNARFPFPEAESKARLENDLCRFGLPEDFSAYSRTRALLNVLRRMTGLVNTVDLVRQAIVMTGYDAVLAGSFHGLQKLANMKKLLSWLANIERSGNLDFQAMVKTLNEMIASDPDEPDAAILDPADDSVKINTVHAAKGLSCPVVFVPDLRFVPRKDQAGIFLLRSGKDNLPVAAGRFALFDESGNKNEMETPGYQAARGAEEEGRSREAKNLFYVACTRGRDLLVLSGENPIYKTESWRSWLNSYLKTGRTDADFRINTYQAIEQSRQNGRKPANIFRAPVKPDALFFENVLKNIPALRLPNSFLRYPATLLTRAARLPADFSFSADARLQKVCSLMITGAQAGDGDELDRLEEGDAETVNDEDRGGISSMPATETPLNKNPSPAEIGTLAHAILAELDYTDPARLDKQIKEHPDYSRLSAGLQNMLGKRVSAVAGRIADMLKTVPAGLVLQEMPFTAKITEGKIEVLIDGAVDLMFFKDNAWHIIDFKFSSESSAQLSENYAFQLQLYRECVSRPAGKHAKMRKVNFTTTADQPAAVNMLILGINEAGELCEIKIEEPSSSSVRERIVRAALLLDQFHGRRR